MDQENTRLVHNVFFSLKDRSPEAAQGLIDACKRYLSDHPGTLYFGAGGCSDLEREVNDRDFDVALHIAFESRAAHDAYQAAPRHQQFIDEQKHNWAKVRVFDSDCRP
jgi:hypothetical protein